MVGYTVDEQGHESAAAWPGNTGHLPGAPPAGRSGVPAPAVNAALVVSMRGGDSGALLHAIMRIFAASKCRRCEFYREAMKELP
jgi:hypothetical protein